MINAIVHNDHAREVPPRFEIFADRIETTSACALPDGLTQAGFLEGFPRNKELMRAFKDLEMVEHLGSVLPRITEFYPPGVLPLHGELLAGDGGGEWAGS